MTRSSGGNIDLDRFLPRNQERCQRSTHGVTHGRNLAVGYLVRTSGIGRYTRNVRVPHDRNRLSS